MENSVKNLIQFIDHSPSCFHVIENAKKQFLEHGFIQLEEKNIGIQKKEKVTLQNEMEVL